MTGEAACFGCGVRFAGEQLEQVGDTVFCRSCLGRMLRRVDERARGGAGPVAAPSVARGAGVNGTHGVPSASARPTAERAAAARTVTADAPCFLCGDPLEGRVFIELRGFAICARCSRGLIGDDAAVGGDAPAGDASPGRMPRADDASAGDLVGDDPSSDRGARGDDAALGDRSPRGGDASRAARARVIETPGSGTEWCSRCDRAMPGPGSYVLVDGRPHCPACAAARAQRPGTSAPASDDPVAPPGSTCDACGRVLGGTTPEIQGFRLCAACQNSDLDLALALARARHQRLLARTGRRLLDGDDD